MSRSIVLEAEYPYPPKRVWRALTDREALTKWLMPNTFAPVVGHKFEFRVPPPHPGWRGFVECEVLEVDEPRRLVYSWVGDPKHPVTIVTWTLVASAAGTRLRLEHSGFQGWRGLFLRWILGSGWKGMVRKLLPEVIGRMGETSDDSAPPSVPPRPS
jgi:uncharacterized protein YndB with AHSA1/START domain